VTTPLFHVNDLHARLADPEAEATSRETLKGLNLTVNPGEVHAIIGSEDSSMSTLGSTLMGSSKYEVTTGIITYRGDDITEWPVDERAKAGLFLAFAHPQEVPGLSVIEFLHQALRARGGIDHEKQCNEIMQMAILKPALAILDHSDSRLDDDTLRFVATGIREVRADHDSIGVVLITHDHHLIDKVAPDHVHIMVDGRIVQSDDMALAEKLERHRDQSFCVGAMV
jgi:Fe-S cluster assembly ATP-binding protein